MSRFHGSHGTQQGIDRTADAEWGGEYTVAGEGYVEPPHGPPYRVRLLVSFTREFADNHRI